MITSTLLLLKVGLSASALIVVLVLVGRAFRRLHHRLRAWHGTEDSYRSDGPLRAPRAAAMLHVLTFVAEIAIMLALVYAYLSPLLRRMPGSRPYAEAIDEGVVAVLWAMTNAFAVYFSEALFFAVVMLVTYVI